VAKLSWDEHVRQDTLREGLSIKLHRQLLGKEKWLNNEQFVALCQELDVGLRVLHHREEKHIDSHAQRTNQSQLRTQLSTVAPTAPAIGRSEPMDLSASDASGGKISEEEQAARLREGHCLYCSGAGHMARHCPNKTRNHFRTTSVQVEEYPDLSSKPDLNTLANPFGSGSGGGNSGGSGNGGQGHSGNT